MVYPWRILVILAAAPAAASLGLLLAPEALPLVAGLDAAVVVLALLDLLTLPSRDDVRVARRVRRVGSLGQRHEVSLAFENPGRKDVELVVKDDVPPSMDAEPSELRVRVPAGSRTEVAYHLRLRERGSWTFERVHGRGTSRMGLWQRRIAWPVESTVSVYPNLKQLTRYALYARVDHLSLIGVRSTRRLGDDNEFERLRDYTADDEYRHIDWRATARRRKLTVRDFQATRCQRVVFLVDCGRMMVSRHGDSSLLDHALDAVLMLSYVALGRGDQVGLMTFSDRVLGYVPPAGGRRQMDRLIREAHDRFPELVESRHHEAFRHLGHRMRKRALVILVTNILDEVNAGQVEGQLRSLTGRHLPLAVLLEDPGLFRFVEEERADLPPDRLFPAAAASSILLWRQRVIRRLEREGVRSLDVSPDRLTPALINEYLRIKARHLL